jgi:DnaJ-class molecular chaperone
VTIDHLDAQYMALGLDPSASDTEVKSAFKKMAMK